MKTRIFDVKTRYASLLALMLGLVVAGPTLAQCNVTLSAILPSNQAVLKADCGAANMTEITWTRDLNAIFPLVPVVLSNSTFPATLADINFTTLLTSGTHSYTASGFFGGTAGVPGSGTAVASGKAAVITLSQPILTVAVSPGGEVDGVPPGITDCRNSGGTCTSGHDTGTSVVLTATADPSFTFASWGGDCVGITTNTCTLSMTTLRTATATFSAVPTYTLTVSSSGGTVTGTGGINCTNGSGTCSASGLASGAAVSLTATPANGNVFNGWSGACSNSSGGCSFSIGTSNAGVTASFGAAPTYALTVSPTSLGTVSGTGILSGISACTSASGVCAVSGLTSGTGGTLTATPAIGNYFTGWGGLCSGTVTCAPTLAANTSNSVTASFSASPTYALTVTTPVNGSVSGTGISCGSTCTVTGLTSSTGPILTATPATGYTFAGWSGGGCSGTGTCSPTLTASSTTIVTATFSVVTNTGTCGAPAGWSCRFSPLTMQPPVQGGNNVPFDINTTLTYAFSATANVVHVHPITFSSSAYPGSGAVITTNQFTFNTNPRDAIISTTPGSMTGVSTFNCRILGSYLGANLQVSFNSGGTFLDGLCHLSKGVQYYLNMKASSMDTPIDYLLTAGAQP